MTWAPVIGLVLALIAVAVILAVRLIGGAPEPDIAWSFRSGWAWITRNIAADVLAAALALALLARLTRALHLDGLIDTADGFGVKGEGSEATQRRLNVMRQPDAGAFGVVTVVLVLLVQVTALAMCLLTGHGTVGLITAVVTGRLALVWSATRLVRPARSDGLGAAFAGSMSIARAAVLTAAVILLAVGLGAIDDDATIRLSVTLGAAVLAGLAVTALLLHRSVRAFGGITGDVMGAAVEIATATVLVVVALVA
jgi:adenosylcobinamide-GDP ribazoletransferase